MELTKGNGQIWIWISSIFFLTTIDCEAQLVPLKNSLNSDECKGIETFEKVAGIELPLDMRYSGTSGGGVITADCYNRCRSSASCTAFWIDYNTTTCYKVADPEFTVKGQIPDFTRASSYFERLCFEGTICNKAWVTERISGYELAGFDDVIIRSVGSRKRCAELCLTDKRLPCRSADYWEIRKECRLSREDRRTQPGAFIRSTSEVEYIESTCSDPLITLKKHCEWEVMQGFNFPIEDFSSKSDSLQECQKQCETYTAFNCRSVTFDIINGICYLSGADVTSTSFSVLQVHDSKVYSQRMPCIDMNLECRGDSMIARLKTHSPFYGKMYSTIQAPECEVYGHGKLLTTIDYPLNKCGVFKDNDGSYVANLVVQNHPLIQKRGDTAFKLVCSFPEMNRTLSQKLGFDRISESRLVESSASTIPTSILGISTSVINSTAKSPSVKLRIQDKKGNDVTGVNLGDELYLIIEVESTSVYGVFARDLMATSGTNEEELVLIDARGCPEDSGIFPHLSKANDGTKSLKGRFEAFKFTNDAVVRFQVYLQFCREECPPVNCDGEQSYGRKKRSSDFNGFKNGQNEFIELQKEIIVSGDPPTGNTKELNIRNRNKGSYARSGDPISYNYKEQARNYNQSPNDQLKMFCGSKSLLIATLIGFSILQILLVLVCAALICQRRRKSPNTFYATDSSSSPTPPPTVRAPPGSSDFFYSRPSQNNLVNTLRAMARRD